MDLFFVSHCCFPGYKCLNSQNSFTGHCVDHCICFLSRTEMKANEWVTRLIDDK